MHVIYETFSPFSWLLWKSIVLPKICLWDSIWGKNSCYIHTIILSWWKSSITIFYIFNNSFSLNNLFRAAQLYSALRIVPFCCFRYLSRIKLHKYYSVEGECLCINDWWEVHQNGGLSSMIQGPQVAAARPQSMEACVFRGVYDGSVPFF